jgi:hypothetical protein
MRKLQRFWGQEITFFDVLIRQAHPGPNAQPYRSLADKTADARRYKEEDAIEYTVLVDDLEGTTHELYGGMADPTYIIDADGRVAFYNMWTHVPTLHRALQALTAQRNRGVVLGGIYRPIRPLASIADGWRGVQRGWPQSAIELELAVPTMASAPFIGYQLRPLLAPIALRATPLPASARLSLAAGVVALAVLAVNLNRSRRKAQV